MGTKNRGVKRTTVLDWKDIWKDFSDICSKMEGDSVEQGTQQGIIVGLVEVRVRELLRGYTPKAESKQATSGGA